jgi:hypothetical protein
MYDPTTTTTTTTTKGGGGSIRNININIKLYEGQDKSKLRDTNQRGKPGI